MRMSFIGAGKVGTALGLYLQRSGFHIEGYYSKSESSTQRAAGLTQSKVIKSMAELVVSSDFIWITVNDDGLEEIDEQLAGVEELTKQHIIAHTSGAYPASILKNLKEKGCDIFSIHPLQAFKELEVSVEALKSTTFAIEGKSKGLDQIKGIFEKTHNPYFILEEKAKTLYHVGACMLSNYLVTLMDSGFNLLEQAGLRREEIFSAVEPLIMGTLENIKMKDPRNALTGPLARGDVKTILRHIQAIEQEVPSESVIYQSMGLKTIEMLEASQETIKNKEAMKEILEGAIDHEK